MSYTSNEEQQQQEQEQQQQEYYNYNDNNDNSSFPISGDPRVRIRRPEYDREPSTSLTQDEQTAFLSKEENETARERVFQNMNRKCQWCKAPIPGEASEYASPQNDHIRSGECQEWNKMEAESESTGRVADTIRGAQQTMEFFAEKRREDEGRIEAEILNLLTQNAQYGEKLLCASVQEWEQRYDHGRKDAKVVCVVSSIDGPGGGVGGHKHKNEKLVVRDYSIDQRGKMYYAPKNITRMIDDHLNEMRYKFPDLMARVDAKLGGANRKLEEGAQ